MLKILGLLGVLLVVVASLSVGTWAYFNDVTSITGNSIAAGTLTLTVDSGSTGAIALTNKKPGDAGNAAIWDINNGGSLDGNLTIATGAITETEDTPVAIRTKVGDAGGDGELGTWLKIAMWMDTNHDGNLDVGETYITHDGLSHAWAGAGNTVFNITNVAAAYEYLSTWDAGVAFGTGIPMIHGATAGNFRVEYNFVEDHAQKSIQAGYTTMDLQNNAQGDSATWDITFTLVQDVVSPSVTINQAVGQADPTASGATPINFTVVFSESVSDFATGDVSLSGTAGGTLVGTVTGSGTTYNVAVSGMTTGGTVIADVAAGVAHDGSGNANTIGTFTDNSVTWTP